MTEKKDDLTGLFDQPITSNTFETLPESSSLPLPLDGTQSLSPSESEFSVPEFSEISETSKNEPPNIDLPSVASPVVPLESPPLESVRQFAEEMPVVLAQSQSEYPFTLKILGHLEDYEKARLLEIVERENIGIRNLDLEPQFESDQILIPRISEFAGVLILQTLRSARIQVEFYPSEQETTSSLFLQVPQINLWERKQDTPHPADLLTLTTSDSLENFKPKDTLIACARLRSDQVGPDASQELSQAVDSLARELKYKAYYKGAKGLIQLKVEQSTVGSDGYYQLTLTATTVC